LEAWLRDGVRTWFNTRILEVDEDVLTVWRRLAFEGQKSGWTCPQPDGLIAATARVHDLAVATRNVADFARSGVAVVDPWGA
ncbi:MAG: VapC toxin family PIN domain ribonuclease, partial [Rhodospirillales bacterium]|nr:VapC toxin family PIN domain ribonuclease [Rhodospirillales bacterium]